jgi:hypothetical protein
MGLLRPVAGKLYIFYLGPNRLKLNSLYKLYRILTIRNFSEILWVASEIIKSNLWAEKL